MEKYRGNVLIARKFSSIHSLLGKKFIVIIINIGIRLRVSDAERPARRIRSDGSDLRGEHHWQTTMLKGSARTHQTMYERLGLEESDLRKAGIVVGIMTLVMLFVIDAPLLARLVAALILATISAAVFLLVTIVLNTVKPDL